jgi:carbonic anhydrase/acetyltransferase-like protein (isoleucine patch superfamily)
VALRVVLYNATLEDEVWVGIGSIIMRASVPSHTMIPAGSVIRTASDVRNFRLINEKEEKYQASVFFAADALREGYMGLRGGSEAG